MKNTIAIHCPTTTHIEIMESNARVYDRISKTNFRQRLALTLGAKQNQREPVWYAGKAFQ